MNRAQFMVHMADTNKITLHQQNLVQILIPNSIKIHQNQSIFKLQTDWHDIHQGHAWRTSYRENVKSIAPWRHARFHEA